MTRKPALMLLMGLTVVVLFIWGAKRQSARVNTDMFSTDQSAYMDYAKGIAQTNFRLVGDRNRMPIYPGLMSFFYEDGMSDQEFFERGKDVGIAIGLASLGVTFLLFRRVSTPMDALAGTLVATFTVLAYKSPYFQAEMLFYAISLVLFYLLLRLLQKPQIRTAALAGLVGGVAHLTKASVLPAVFLAAVLVVVRGAFGIRRRHQDTDTPPDELPRSRFALNHLGYASIFLGCFLLVVFPYIRTSKERFGQYFYNVNSTFYVWYDSWEEAKRGTRGHGDREGWPDMPEDQIPSLGKYVREHSLREILGRFALGLRDLRSRIIRSSGYAEFLLVYAIALGVLFVQNKDVWLTHTLRRAHPLVLLFIPGYLLGYTLLYAWYTPIASGDRLILSLFLPAMLLMVWALSHARDLDLSYELFGIRISASTISPAVLLFLAAYVLAVFPLRVSTMSGGG